jgi:hypothetical protein
VDIHNQSLAQGKKIIVKVAPAELGRRFTINLKKNGDNNNVPLHLDFRGKEWSNCLVINEKKNGQWQGELRYCPKPNTINMDDLFKDGAEIEIDLENKGAAIKINGNEVMENEMINRSGRAAGEHTYNDKLNYAQLDEIEVRHSTGKFIQSVELV